jgi:prepilin peptidase CpaA
MITASAIATAGMVGCVITAAISDARTLRIPNILSASIAALFAVHAALDLTMAATLGALALAAATLIAGFIAFARGKLGGGDVKLLTVCIAWAGPQFAADFLIVTGLAGGVLAVALLSPLTQRATSGLQRHWPESATTAATATSAPMPYGIAIAAGAIVVAARIMSA